MHPCKTPFSVIVEILGKVTDLRLNPWFKNFKKSCSISFLLKNKFNISPKYFQCKIKYKIQLLCFSVNLNIKIYYMLIILETYFYFLCLYVKIIITLIIIWLIDLNLDLICLNFFLTSKKIFNIVHIHSACY